MQAGGLLLS